jgi:hypothetical protein
MNILLHCRYYQFLELCAKTLSSAYDRLIADNFVAEKERSAWKGAVLSCLRACCLDFDGSDHDALDKAGLLPVLERLLQSPDRDVSSTAEAVAEVLVARCVGLELLSDIASEGFDEPSAFSTKLARLLISRLEVNENELSGVSL